MNKIICTIVTASVLLGGAAYGQNKSTTTHDKQPLRDSQMDKVTAAGEENSAIAANNSVVNENNANTSAAIQKRTMIFDSLHPASSK